MRNTKAKALTESAVLIALATILSLLKIVDLPYGGSVTIASMLPIILISYRHGLGWGIGSGLTFGIIQQLLGLSSLSYVTTWQSILAVILLDYIIAYAVAGLGGIFRKRLTQSTALVLGTILVCALRYACHVLSGATVWAGISIPTAAALLYSLIYNATYMLPETIIAVLIAAYLSLIMDFNAGLPIRVTGSKKNAVGVLGVLSGLVITGALVFDIAAIFSKLQNAETGEFAITQISTVNWPAVGIVSGIAVLVAVVLCVISTSKKQSA